MSPDKGYWHNFVGFNYRMNEFSAAIALAQCERVNYFVRRRRDSAISMVNILKNKVDNQQQIEA